MPRHMLHVTLVFSLMSRIWIRIFIEPVYCAGPDRYYRASDKIGSHTRSICASPVLALMRPNAILLFSCAAADIGDVWEHRIVAPKTR